MTEEDLRWIIVAGPTASGKSEIALDLAERFRGEIVNADSRQVYRGMDVGTAKPTAEERRRVPHHLYDVATPDRPLDAARYTKLARSAIADVAARGRTPFVVGGTGLYIRTVARGLFAGSGAEPALRRALQTIEAASPGALHRWCRRLDPEVASRVHANDVVRLVRAIEVALVMGEPLGRFQARHGFGERLGRFLYLVLDPDRAELRRRIVERSRRMFESGLVGELEALRRAGYDHGLRVLQSIGYREAATVLDGVRTVAQATEDLVSATRRFAKRQRTWFRGEREAIVIDPAGDHAGLLSAVARFLDDAAGTGR